VEKGGPELVADPQQLDLIRTTADVPISKTRWCQRLGIPRSTYHRRLARAQQGQVGKGPWPAPVVEAITEDAVAMAQTWSAWGHRKVAAMLHADGHTASTSSILRALRRAGMVQPVDYQRQRRELARARKAAFVDPPDRRNRVWQMDFSEFETLGGGIWRICAIVDYQAKVCLAARLSTTMGARDAVLTLDQAVRSAAALLELDSLADDCLDPATGEIAKLTVVSDNGPAFKAAQFARYFAGRQTWLAHVRTRHKAPETNGVVERFFQAIKYEDLYRHEITDGPMLHDRLVQALDIYNTIRPHETLGQVPPMPGYLAAPNIADNESVSTT
jgi:transposase InsO family protein